VARDRIAHSSNPGLMTERQAILDAKGLTKTFGTLEALKGVDLAVERQELVFIIGPSGSGKSTLLRCCNRLEEPTAGSVIVDGVDILADGVNINQVRRQIGMVFQSFNLYPHMTALGNVTLALRRVLKLRRDDAEARGQAALGYFRTSKPCLPDVRVTPERRRQIPMSGFRRFMSGLPPKLTVTLEK